MRSKIGERMIEAVSELLFEYPLAHANWLCASDFALYPVFEVGILGVESPQLDDLVNALWESYRPNIVAAISAFPPPPNAPRLLNNRPLLNGNPTAYVCQNHTCNHPVNDPEEMADQLSNPLA